VWTDDRNGNWDIYGYDLSTKEEFQITTDESDQRFPAIYGSTVVWQDERNGNSDIYGVDLGIDCTTFTCQEGDFFFEKGKKEIEERNHKKALYSFQLARQKYTFAGVEEKIKECDEWILECQSELEGICMGTYLLLIFMVLGVLVSIQRRLCRIHRNLHIESDE
jgi:beta propeller repeat protein